MALSSSASSTTNYMRLTYPGYFKFSRPRPCFFASFRRPSSSGISCSAYYRNYDAASTRYSSPGGPTNSGRTEWKNLTNTFKNAKKEDDEKKTMEFLNLKVSPRDPPSTNGSSNRNEPFDSKYNSSVSTVEPKNLPSSMINFSKQEKLSVNVSRNVVNGAKARPKIENFESLGTEAGTKANPVMKEIKTVVTEAVTKTKPEKKNGKSLTEAETKAKPVRKKVKSVVFEAETKAKPVMKKVKSVATEGRLLMDKVESVGNEVESNGMPLLEKVESVVIEAETKAGPLVEIVESVVTEPETEIRRNLNSIFKSVLVVDCVSTAEHVVNKLLTSYRHFVHACDTEVAEIDVKQETPIDHGKMTCFSVYSGPTADFGDGKSCIWVDILDGGRDVLNVFRPFFEDESIKKVWHNYSFDNHIISNYKIKMDGFHADTMHMARLWDSSRRLNGGYSLEALTCDPKVIGAGQPMLDKIIGKVSMKTIFGKRKVKKDGSEGKLITIPPVEELQRNDRQTWICYSSLDAITTLQLYESLKKKLSDRKWKMNEKVVNGKNMYDFYHNYWRPFGEILVQMEREGMLVDRDFLSEIEKVARKEQEEAVNRFRNWASKYCADAKYMNVGSDTQLRQLFFGGTFNSKDPEFYLEKEKTFKVPNVENVFEEGKKKVSKYRNIVLSQIGVAFPVEMYTVSGWPSVSGNALRALAGKVSADYYILDDPAEADSEELKMLLLDDIDVESYGTAYNAFKYKNEGVEACHAIASLCEVCSIDSLISNFILPLQQSNISGEEGRIHCSLNINTETGRLSARRPNLQNQPALEKDRYKIRKAFIAAEGNSLIVADYGQLELRILAHLANCKSMLNAFKAGGDFHSRTAMNMYSYIREAIDCGKVILEWHPQPGQEKPPVPLLKDAYASERRKAKMLNFSIAYGKTAVGLSRDWKVSVDEAQDTVDLWYSDRKEVLKWQEDRKAEARELGCVYTLLGRPRNFPLMKRDASRALKNHIERAAINTPVQGSAADVAMCAMLEISRNNRLKELGWKLLLQVHDEVILEGPKESEEVARQIVVECMSKPFNGQNFLNVDLAVDAKCAENWYSAK